MTDHVPGDASDRVADLGFARVDVDRAATYVELKGVDHFATPKDFKFLDAALEFLGAG